MGILSGLSRIIRTFGRLMEFGCKVDEIDLSVSFILVV